MLTLRTLGTITFCRDSTPLLPGRRKVLALLTVLARRSPESVARAQLSALLWGDRDAARAKQSLRQALVELRAVLPDAIRVEPDALTLPPDLIRLDVDDFEEAVRLEHWAEAADLWHGDFLLGLDGVAGEAWSDWIRAERERLRPSAVRVFDWLVAERERRNDWRGAIEAAQRWCALDALDERSASRLLEVLVHAGKLVDASVHFEAFAHRVEVTEGRQLTDEFRVLRSTFAAEGAHVTMSHALPRGEVTLSELAQLTPDARTTVEAAAMLGEAATAAHLQAITELTPHAFRHATDDLLARTILLAPVEPEDSYRFTSEANRRRVRDVIAPHRRQALQQAVDALIAPPPAPHERRRKPRASRRRALPSVPWRLPTLAIPRRAVVAAGAGLVATIAAITVVARVTGANAATIEAGSKVLLTDVQNLTGDSAFDGALDVAATVSLQQSRHVTLVPRSRVRAALRHKGEQDSTLHIEEASARDIARRDSVVRVVSLRVSRLDSAYELSARLIDPVADRVLGTERTQVASRDQLIAGMDRLVHQVRLALGEPESSLRSSSRPLRQVASGSLQALAAYAAGERASALGREAEARTYWQRALNYDSTFALAALALASTAASDEGAPAAGEHWIRKALAHAERLTTTDSLRARQVAAMQEGRFGEAAQLAARLTRLEDSRENWYRLGAAYVAENQCERGVAALTRALAFDSTFAPAHLGMATCYLQAGDAAKALAAFQRVQRSDSSLLNEPENATRFGMALVRAGEPAKATAAFDRLFATGLPEDSIRAFHDRAYVRMYQGRYAEAIADLEQATRLVRRSGSPGALVASLLLETNAYVAIGGHTRASELIDEVLTIVNDSTVDAVARFRLGQVMARIGRINGAREVLRQLSASVVPGNARDQWAERLLVGAVRVAEKNAPDALDAMDDPSAPADLAPYQLAVTSDANLLAGQFDAALAAARHLADGWYFGTAAQDEWMRGTLRVARVAEAMGDTTTARAAYTRYIERWKGADIYLMELASAQRSLSRLGGTVVAMDPER